VRQVQQRVRLAVASQRKGLAKERAGSSRRGSSGPGGCRPRAAFKCRALLLHLAAGANGGGAAAAARARAHLVLEGGGVARAAARQRRRRKGDSERRRNGPPGASCTHPARRVRDDETAARALTALCKAARGSSCVLARHAARLRTFLPPFPHQSARTNTRLSPPAV